MSESGARQGEDDEVERIFTNRSIRLRMWLGILMIGAAGALGLWFIGMRLTEGTQEEGEEALFVGLFLVAIAVAGGLRLGHYGYQTVIALEADETSGNARLALWRPLGEHTLETRLTNLVEWRYEVGRKNTRMPIYRFRARHAEPHHWLVFEISPREGLHPLFRETAGAAVDDFEQQTGIAYFRSAQDTANSR